VIAIRGYSSSVAQDFIKHLPEWETITPVERGTINTNAERHLFAQGLMFPKKIGEMNHKEKADSWHVNAGMVIEQCNLILAVNPDARICILGSESGYAWSYDDCYAMAKAAVHRYVETKALKPNQQLVCVAPTIIGDSRMTLAREDKDNLARRAEANPKRRFVMLSEVSAMIHHLLYIDRGYTTGIVIRMNGGMHIK
jgi:NAD(P)-dependent dehydrogenase (short-subunit alcohol dehydrogenase family)